MIVIIFNLIIINIIVIIILYLLDFFQYLFRNTISITIIIIILGGSKGKPFTHPNVASFSDNRYFKSFEVVYVDVGQPYLVSQLEVDRKHLVAPCHVQALDENSSKYVNR